LKDDKCYICLRIGYKRILSHASKLWKDEKTAKKIALASARLINKANNADRFFFCGKGAKSILSGLFYLLSFRFHIPFKQNEMEYAGFISTAKTVTTSCRRWLEHFPKLFPEFRLDGCAFGRQELVFLGIRVCHLRRKSDFEKLEIKKDA